MDELGTYEVIQRLKLKADGYNLQDTNSGRLYYSEKFKRMNKAELEYTEIVDLIKDRGLCCHYCHRLTSILPKRSKDPFQFTLDRVDNDKTHHIQNCVVACLQCNSLRSNKFSSNEFYNKRNLI